MTDPIEIMARAISGAPFPSKRSIAKAQAALKALSDAGFVVVPREPTPEMVAAFWRQKNTGCQEPGLMGPDRDDYSAYRAMIDAAQVTK